MSKENKCANCGSTSTVETQVDGRSMFECGSCSNVWYSERAAHSAYTDLADAIINDVEVEGCCEIDLETLLNSAFTQTQRTFKTWEQIRQWALLNKLKVDRREDTIYFRR